MLTGSPYVHDRHAVTFYANDDQLFTTVAAFFGDGLDIGEPALVIATEPHAIGIFDALRARQIDVDAAVARGDIVVVDAVETLERIMIDNEIDPDRFARALDTAIESTVKGRPAGTAVRAYGEMVDVLCQNGQQDEAIRLEILWNRGASGRPVSVLCGYAADAVAGDAIGRAAVCRLHSHIIAA